MQGKNEVGPQINSGARRQEQRGMSKGMATARQAKVADGSALAILGTASLMCEADESLLEALPYGPVSSRRDAPFVPPEDYRRELKQRTSNETKFFNTLHQASVGALICCYTAELPRLLRSYYGVICKQFADDIKVYRKIEGIDDIRNIQSSLDSILQWSKSWSLPLAPEKTVFMRIGGSILPGAYRLGEHILNEVSAVKDLGFHYAYNKLSFSDHYESIFRKATFRRYQIFKGLTVNDKEVLIREYKTYVSPIAECGVSVFCPCKNKDVNYWKKFRIIIPVKYILSRGSTTANVAGSTEIWCIVAIADSRTTEGP
ncbi:hypothetical protein OSTOST_06815 [Ostertagia ostertagi]